MASQPGRGTAAVAPTPTTPFSTNTVGGRPESKHLDGSNYGGWKFVTPDPNLDERTLAKINLSVKPNVSTQLEKCKSQEAWKKLQDV